MKNPFKSKCSIWYCFRKGKHGLQIDVAGHNQVVGWYCDSHAEITDEMFNAGEIKTKLPIGEYKGL